MLSLGVSRPTISHSLENPSPMKLFFLGDFLDDFEKDPIWV